MPLQEFWYENPDLLWIYRTSFISKREEEIEYQHECINYQAWLTGVYIQQAVGSLLDKKVKYPDKPYSLNNKKGSNSKAMLEQKIRNQLYNGQNILRQKENINGRE